MKRLNGWDDETLLTEDIKFFFNMVKNNPQDMISEQINIDEGKPSPRFGRKSFKNRRSQLKRLSSIERTNKKKRSPIPQGRKSRSRKPKYLEVEDIKMKPIRKKTPVRNSDRAVVKRFPRNTKKSKKNQGMGERRNPPQASKSPSRPPLVQQLNNNQYPRTPKKQKRWEQLYNMANSKAKNKSKTPRKHVQLSKEKDKYYKPKAVRTPRNRSSNRKSKENSQKRERVRPFHLRIIPKSPRISKRSASKRRPSSSYKYSGKPLERSTQKKQTTLFNEYENGNYIQEKVKFSNSNSKVGQFSQIDQSWKERTLKRSRLFMTSQQSISSINTNTNNLTNISSMAMMGLCFEGAANETEDTNHTSYVKYKSSSTNDSLQDASESEFQKRSPRLHEIRKIQKLSKKMSLESKSMQSSQNWSIPSLQIAQSKIERQSKLFHVPTKQSTNHSINKELTLDYMSTYNTDRPHEKSPVRHKHPLESSIGDSSIYTNFHQTDQNIPEMSFEQVQSFSKDGREIEREIEAERLDIVKMLEDVIRNTTPGTNDNEFNSAEAIFKKYKTIDPHIQSIESVEAGSFAFSGKYPVEYKAVDVETLPRRESVETNKLPQFGGNPAYFNFPQNGNNQFMSFKDLHISPPGKKNSIIPPLKGKLSNNFILV